MVQIPPALRSIAGLTILAIIAGASDGIFRAMFGLPTILGEDVPRRADSHASTHLPRSGSLEEMGKFDLSSLAGSWLDRSQFHKNSLHQTLGSPCSEALDCKMELVCRDGVCSECATSEECQERGEKRKCFNSSSSLLFGPKVDHAVCRHKDLLSPFDSSDLLITFVTLVVTALSVPTGTGGGGILVPTYIILGQFTTHAAIPLSKATIFGGAVINNILNLQRRHPFANRPMVGYDIVYIMGPAILTGSVVGVLLNGICPGWLLAVLIAVLLAFSTWKTAFKSYEIYCREARAGEVEENQALLGGGGEAPKPHYSFATDAAVSQQIRDICEVESQHDVKAISVLTVTWLLITVTSMLKANAFVLLPIYVPCGTILFWAIALIPLPFFFLVYWISGTEVRRIYEDKVSMGYRFSEGDLQWTSVNVRLYPLMGLFVGIIAGALGLGGGILLAPFILELGSLPMVTVATTSFFVMFTTSSTSVQYIFLGQLTVDYALFFSAVGGTGAAIGNIAINTIATRTRRSWFLVAIMSFLLFVSMFLMTWMAWVDLEHNGADARDICEIKA